MMNVMAFTWIYTCDVLLKCMLQFSRPDSVFGSSQSIYGVVINSIGFTKCIGCKMSTKDPSHFMTLYLLGRKAFNE